MIAFYRLFPELRRDVARGLGQRLSEVPERTWPNVFASSTGAVVTVVNHLLRGKGYPVTPSGFFTAATVSAVHDWQTQHGITPTPGGEVSDATWESLVTPVEPGATGDPVTALQSILLPKGYPVTVTGTFDEDTRRAVRELQHLHRLPPHGRVDLDTWCAAAGGVVRAEFRGALRP